MSPSRNFLEKYFALEPADSPSVSVIRQNFSTLITGKQYFFLPILKLLNKLKLK